MRPQNGMMDCQNATSLSSHNHVILSSCLGKFICNYLLVIAGWVKLMYFSCFSLLLCCRFPNKQTRKQPQSTEGSIWPMFFVDGSRCFCVCGQLSCARLGTLLGAWAFYLHKWVLLCPCLPQGEDGSITFSKVKSRGGREGENHLNKISVWQGFSFLPILCGP